MSEPTQLSDSERATVRELIEKLREFVAETPTTKGPPRRELTQYGAALLLKLYEEQTERIGALDAAVQEAAQELTSVGFALRSKPIVDEGAEDASEQVTAWNEASIALQAAEAALAKVMKGGR
jgi:hypothetical protein